MDFGGFPYMRHIAYEPDGHKGLQDYLTRLGGDPRIRGHEGVALRA